MNNNTKSHASCSRCKLPFFNVDGHTMCFRCREDAAITNLAAHPLALPCAGCDCPKAKCDAGKKCCPDCEHHDVEPFVPELENTPAVDHETNQRCSFCQRQILGVRIVITKAGTTWIQLAAGAWIGVNELRGNELEVRCAGCLLPEV